MSDPRFPLIAAYLRMIISRLHELQISIDVIDTRTYRIARALSIEQEHPDDLNQDQYDPSLQARKGDRDLAAEKQREAEELRETAQKLLTAAAKRAAAP